MKDINQINDEYKIDLDSLNKFLLEKGDEYLDYLLAINCGFMTIDKLKKYITNKIALPTDLESIQHIIIKLDKFKDTEKDLFDYLQKYYSMLAKLHSSNSLHDIKPILDLDFIKNNKYFSFDEIINNNPEFILMLPYQMQTEELWEKVILNNLFILHRNEMKVILPYSLKTNYDFFIKLIKKDIHSVFYYIDKFVGYLSDGEIASLYQYTYNQYNNKEEFWNDCKVIIDNNMYINKWSLRRIAARFGDESYLENIGLNLNESKSLLKENYLEDINDFNSYNKIDLGSLNDFLIKKGDYYLDYLLLNKGYSNNVDENKIRQYVLKNYVINENLLQYITKDKELYDFCETMVELKKVFYTGNIIKKFDKNTKLPKEFYNNKYFTFERLLKNYIYNFQFIDESDLTQEICNLAVSLDFMLFRKVPTRFKTYDLCKKVITSFLGVNHDLPYPHMFEDSPITEEECYSLIKIWYNNFYVNNKYNGENEFWLTHKDMYNFKYFPKKYYIRLINDFNLYSQEFIKKYEIDFYNNTLNESKSLLKEGITDEVYHFTPYNSAINILTNNKFKFSIEKEDDSLSRMNGYKNYMSVSRTKSLDKGFFKTIKNGYNLIIRFKLDGRKLAQKYKGIAFNYYPNWGKGKPVFEYEDRILSNDEYIENFSKYLLSIDIIDTTLVDNLNKNRIQEIKDLSKKLNIPTNIIKYDENEKLKKEFYSNPIKYITDKGTFLLDETFFTKEIFDLVYNHFKTKIINYLPFSKIPNEFRTYEICKLYIRLNPILITFIKTPEENFLNNPLTEEDYISLVRLAFSLDKTIITYLSQKYHDMLMDEINNLNKNNSLQENKSVLKEGISDEVYHFTSLENLVRILKSNTLNLSFMDNDINQPYHEKNSNIYKILNKYMYYLSLSRTKSVDKGYAKVLTVLHGTPVIARIKLDGRKLSFNNKIIPFDYNNYINSKPDKILTNFEYEDRLVSDKPSIKNINNFILEIDIFVYYNHNFQKNSFLYLKDYQNKTNIPIKVFNKVKNNTVINEENNFRIVGDDELLGFVSDKHKLDINSLNNFLLENNDSYLEYLLFDNDYLDIKENLDNIIRNKYVTNFNKIPINDLYKPKIIKQIILRNPELINRLNIEFLSSMEDTNQEMKDVYKYVLKNKPFMLGNIPTNLEYYNELLDTIHKNSLELFDIAFYQPKNEHQKIYLSRVRNFLRNKGYDLKENPS